MAIIQPIKNLGPFARTKITARNRVLLWGPSRCGKSLLGKAAASASKANFISAQGPELLELNKVPTLISISHNFKVVY